MNIITGIDIAIVVILIGAVIFGYMTGLIMQIAHLVALAVAYITAISAAKLAPLQIGGLVVFSVVFLVVFAILRQVIKLLKIVDHIPVIGFVSHIGGALAGFLINFIIIYIICNIFFGIMPQELLDYWGLTKNAIEGSLLLQVFC